MKHFYWPLKTPVNVTQYFYDDMACISNKDNKTVVYKKTEQTCPVGFRSLYSKIGSRHSALDIVARRWQEVYASREGTVVELQTEEARGLGIGILHGPYEGKYYKTRYWHLAAMDVNLGERVMTGQLIGYADNTGFSSGDHLHFEIKETDNKGNTIKAVDPIPLLFDDSAVKINKLRLIVEGLASLLDKLSDSLRMRKV